jgi:muramoyltetrapeptide carboxypeptidase LdcA involved in peptidoglycan recycling
MHTSHVKISLTEMPHFRRLVMFLEDVESHAAEHCDLELKQLVEDTRSDLLAVRED